MIVNEIDTEDRLTPKQLCEILIAGETHVYIPEDANPLGVFVRRSEAGVVFGGVFLLGPSFEMDGKLVVVGKDGAESDDLNDAAIIISREMQPDGGVITTRLGGASIGGMSIGDPDFLAQALAAMTTLFNEFWMGVEQHQEEIAAQKSSSLERLERPQYPH